METGEILEDSGENKLLCEQPNSILVGCGFKNEKSFSNSNDESRLFYLLSKIFSVK
jgi:hypothetical protein